MSLKKGNLEAVRIAIVDLGENRLDGVFAPTISGWLDRINELIVDRENARSAIIKEYAVDGEDSVGIESEGYAECLGLVTNLFNEPVVFDFEPIEFNSLPDSIKVAPNSFAILKECGAVTDTVLITAEAPAE